MLGARGQMGGQVCRAVEAADDMELVAQVDAGDDLETLVSAGAQVVVDFTHPDVVMDNLRVLHRPRHPRGRRHHRLRRRAARPAAHRARRVAADRGARRPELRHRRGADDAVRGEAAPFFESVEIVELHHPDKVDAPSGTARRTASLVAEARRRAGAGPMPDATSTSLEGARGADVDGVRVHAVRLRGLVAHQEVLLGGPGETLTLRHDSMDRESFMPGVLLGVRSIASHPGLTVGLEQFMGLG